MEALDEIFTEQQVEKLASKVLSSVTNGIKDKIADAFYSYVKDYLYEHYDNAKSEIKEKIIKEISDQYIKQPLEYKFTELRKKMFEENKETIINALNDEIIRTGIENCFSFHTSSDYYFNWQWKENIAKFILDNFNKFKDDERVNSIFIRQIENLKTENNNLKQQINNIKELTGLETF